MGTLAEVAKDTGGTLHGPDHAFESVSTDSRTIVPGQLFVALRGERFDARDFVADAAGKGAVGAIVEQPTDVALAQVEVADAKLALADLARHWRQSFSIPVIGITGSNGKTTVKELVAAIMRAAHKNGGEQAVLATRGNLNNDIGVPLTLLRLRSQHEVAVIEMGANHPGEISILADIARPTVAIITNAARAHLEGFGSIEDVAHTKGGILDSLRSGDTAILNRDDDFFADWAARASDATVISFGASDEANIRAENVAAIVNDGQSCFDFDLIAPVGKVHVSLPLAGRHNVMNALAAAGAALAAGATLEDVRDGLANSSNVPGRLRSFMTRGGAVIFDDSYNANPDSVAAAIHFLQGLEGEPLLVLGDMGELGPDAPAMHREIGKLANKVGISRLYCTGELSRETAAGFGESANWFATAAELQEALLPELHSGRNILIKASRFVGLDRLVRHIEETEG